MFMNKQNICDLKEKFLMEFAHLAANRHLTTKNILYKTYL